MKDLIWVARSGSGETGDSELGMAWSCLMAAAWIALDVVAPVGASEGKASPGWEAAKFRRDVQLILGYC
jgi:hypothetical protein